MDSFMERFQALSIGEKIILIAGLLLLIASFLPWYSIDLGPFGSVSRSGWQSPGAFWSIIAVFIGFGMAGVVAAKIADLGLPDNIGGQTWGRIHLAGGGIALVFLIIKFINENSYLSFGFYLGFICALALAAGGALMFRDEGGQLPGMPSSGGPSSGPPPGGPPSSPPSNPPANPPGPGA